MQRQNEDFNYHIYYCDDASSDGTSTAVLSYVQEMGKQDSITLITNQERCYKLANLYSIIHSLPDYAVVVEIDGDDFLLTDDVFEYIVELYKTGDVWMTYGGFVAWPRTFSYLQCKKIPESVVMNNSFRSFYYKNFIFMALRTFYAGLFKRIKKNDLCDKDGKFFTRSSDVVTMIPMFEMAGSRFHFIQKDVYGYNTDTGFNDYQQDFSTQKAIFKSIYSGKKYKPIKSCFN